MRRKDFPRLKRGRVAIKSRCDAPHGGKAQFVFDEERPADPSLEGLGDVLILSSVGK
jgi:hypothetical protein